MLDFLREIWKTLILMHLGVICLLRAVDDGYTVDGTWTWNDWLKILRILSDDS